MAQCDTISERLDSSGGTWALSYLPPPMPMARTTQFPRAFSVDGSMCNLPTPGAPQGLGQSSREYPRPFAASSFDPPRPARAGYEWVWFPEGYWAEREYRVLDRSHSRASDLRIWKRRRQSRKSHSGSGHDAGPLTVTGASAYTPLSPYLSEEAHVLSLQHPLGIAVDKGEQKEERAAPEDQPQSAAPTALPKDESAAEASNRPQMKRFPAITWNRLGQSLRGVKDVGDPSPIEHAAS